MWASHHAARMSNGVVSPHVCAHMSTLARGAVLTRGRPSLGSAVEACRNAPERARQAERATDGHDGNVPRALSVSPNAPCMDCATRCSI